MAKGKRLARKGKWADAATAYKDALRIDPTNVEALMNLGFVYYEMGLDDQARETLAAAEALRGPSESCNPSGL